MLQALSREKHKNIVQVLFTYQNVAADKRVSLSNVTLYRCCFRFARA